MMTEAPTPSPLLVRDLMTVGVATCPPDALVADLARLMLEKNLEAVVVLDPEEGHALGVVGQEELARAYSRLATRSVDAIGDGVTAAQVMREEVPKVPADIPLAVAAQMMHDLHTRALFVMHHAAGVEYPAALITYQHLLRRLAARSPEELRDLGIGAERKSPIDIFLQRRDEARRRNLGQ